MVNQAGVHIGSCSMKQLKVILLPPGWVACQSQAGLPSVLKSLRSYYGDAEDNVD